ncbi:UDP-glucose 4-epimerase, partial [Escherichia coli]|nr:UDP-glucose 4-epimerase [Escherichia coli]
NKLDDYTSHNTERLNVEQIKALLLTLKYVQKELGI